MEIMASLQVRLALNCCLFFTTFAAYDMNYGTHGAPTVEYQQQFNNYRQMEGPRAHGDYNVNDDFKLQAALNSELTNFKDHLTKSSYRSELRSAYGGVPKAEVDAAPYAMPMGNIFDIKQQRSCCLPKVNKDEENNKTSNKRQHKFVGTNLFGGHRKKSYSTDDVAVVTARRDFEMLLPHNRNIELVNDEQVAVILKYFRTANHIVKQTTNEDVKHIAQTALFDAIGGYLSYHLVPIAKLSFYGGRLNEQTVQNVIDVFQQCKVFLNTNGNGWRQRGKNLLTSLKPGSIKPLNIIENKAKDSACCNLEITAEGNGEAGQSNMLVPLPKLEIEDNCLLDNIWLPLKKKHIYNLRAVSSAFIVVKFYETVLSCFEFQSLSPDVFNRKFRNWLEENVLPHLADEQLYPGLGGILRLYESCHIKYANSKDSDIEYQDDNDYQVHNVKHDNEIVNTLSRYHAKSKKQKAAANKTKETHKRDYTVELAASNATAEEEQPVQEEEESNKIDVQTKNEEESHDEISANITNVVENPDPKPKENPYSTGDALGLNENQENIILIGGIVAIIVFIIMYFIYKMICCKRCAKAAYNIPPSDTKPIIGNEEAAVNETSSVTAEIFNWNPAPNVISDGLKAAGGVTSSSAMLCQLPRRCIPIPYSNLGTRLTKKEVLYSSTEGESDNGMLAKLRGASKKREDWENSWRTRGK